MNSLNDLARARADIKELKNDVASIQVAHHVFKTEIATSVKAIALDVGRLAEETGKLLRLTKLVDSSLTDIQILKETLGLLRARAKRLEAVLEDPIKAHYRREALKTWGLWPIHPVRKDRKAFYRTDLLSKLKPVGFDLQRIDAVNDLLREGILVKVRGGRLKWGPEDLVKWLLAEEGV